MLHECALQAKNTSFYPIQPNHWVRETHVWGITSRVSGFERDSQCVPTKVKTPLSLAVIKCHNYHVHGVLLSAARRRCQAEALQHSSEERKKNTHCSLQDKSAFHVCALPKRRAARRLFTGKMCAQQNEKQPFGSIAYAERQEEGSLWALGGDSGSTGLLNSLALSLFPTVRETLRNDACIFDLLPAGCLNTADDDHFSLCGET